MCYFVVFSTFQSRNAHIQRLNFDQLDPFSQMTPKVCYINLKNSENLSRAGLWAGDIRVIQSGRRYVG
jgi:hypothetical protein